jgi:putative tryptophan/tyrosine transport system substrate-binding protein
VNRRQFIGLLGGVAAWPLVARGQEHLPKPRRIGYLGPTSLAAQKPWTIVFVQRLRELGWVDGRDVAIEYRWAEGRDDRFGPLIAELVRLDVDVIVTSATLPALAAKQATSAIPIVFTLATDPVGSGLVASLARPGGNATGFSLQNIDLVGKRVEFLREIVSDLSRLAIMANVAAPDSATELREAEAIARRLDLGVATLELRQVQDIAAALAALQSGTQALLVVGDPMTFAHRTEIASFAQAARLPTMVANREFVAAGCLMSYGTNFTELFRRSASLVDKILRGAKPGDIPVEQPTKFDFVINMKTAKALGLEIPPTVLARADEVIE